ncbi:hypothetical protein F4775DRAFT_299623 [Biscogniauxia sp. FL1348]|nr:hypothetical protein F4775DRAFT_299623 [Biscogniauxia sp. FL1348]
MALLLPTVLTVIDCQVIVDLGSLKSWKLVSMSQPLSPHQTVTTYTRYIDQIDTLSVLNVESIATTIQHIMFISKAEPSRRPC